MRNLKRALSLALASIMLLGMMVTGAGAASNSFTDFDQIVNQEAAEVTSGLGIFDGYTDGSFGPEKVVTRAEMAVIICKLLNGSDVDPGNFTGISKFTDVPAWAEGYVNYCAAAGIVVGVGEGKFNPSATVTTVEAATMLLKALGYFTEEDKLQADWKTVVTGRATGMHLYGTLTLAVDEGLTRDNVAELVFNTLFAQRVAYDDNRQLYVKNTNRDVVVTNGTEDYYNTFAENTFHMWVVDGLVTANSFTDDDLSETTNNAPRTNVVFDAAAAQDYPATTYQGSTGSEYPFEYTTGLDMIGHSARVYYRMERNAPVVFAIADRATKVEYITYDSNLTNLSDAANAAGFRRNTIREFNSDDYKVNYDWDVTVGTLRRDSSADNDVNLTGDKTIDPAKTLLVISNSTDYAVDCVIVLDQYLDTVKRVVTKNDVTEYDLTTIDGVDQNIAHDSAAQGDYVVVTDIGKQGDMLNFELAEKVSANITKITGKSDSNATVKSIVADGTTYVGSPVYDHRIQNSALENTTDFEDIATIGEATLLLDFQGKCIGLAQPESTPNYAYAAQFGVWHTGGSLNTEFKLTVKLYFLDGTSGVYLVNTDASESSNTFYGLKLGVDEAVAENYRDILNGGANKQYNVLKTYNPKIDVGTGNAGEGTKGVIYLNGWGNENTNDVSGLGIYKATVRADDTVVLKALGEHDAVASTYGDQTKIIPGHSTLVKANGQNLTCPEGTGNNVLFQNNKTVYFYVSGTYDDLSVGAKYGVNNAVSITNSTHMKTDALGIANSAKVETNDKDNNGENDTIVQILTGSGGRKHEEAKETVEAVLVWGYDLGSSDTMYFYRQNSYDIEHKDNASSRAGEKLYTITYHMYTADGEPYEAHFDNGGKYYDMETAKETVSEKPTGFYTLGSKDINRKWASNETDKIFYVKNNVSIGTTDGAKNVYVLNAIAKHDTYVDNLYTHVEDVGGIIPSTAKVVSTVDNCTFDSINEIARACDNGALVKISYTYSTSDYKVKTVFITEYNKNGGVNAGSGADLWSEYRSGWLYVFNDKANGENYIDVANSAKTAMEKAGYTVTNLQPYSRDSKNNICWTMEATLNGTKYYFTNGESGLGAGVNGWNYYVNITKETARVLINGGLDGYYTLDAHTFGSSNSSVEKGNLYNVQKKVLGADNKWEFVQTGSGILVGNSKVIEYSLSGNSIVAGDTVNFVSTTNAGKTYTITVAADGNGTVLVADKAVEGSTVDMTVTPAAGYALDSLTVTDANGNKVTVTDNSFTMPSSNVTITATFKESKNTSGEASGTVGGKITLPADIKVGDTVKITVSGSESAPLESGKWYRIKGGSIADGAVQCVNGQLVFTFDVAQADIDNLTLEAKAFNPLSVDDDNAYVFGTLSGVSGVIPVPIYKNEAGSRAVTDPGAKPMTEGATVTMEVGGQTLTLIWKEVSKGQWIMALDPDVKPEELQNELDKLTPNEDGTLGAQIAFDKTTVNTSKDFEAKKDENGKVTEVILPDAQPKAKGALLPKTLVIDGVEVEVVWYYNGKEVTGDPAYAEAKTGYTYAVKNMQPTEGSDVSFAESVTVKKDVVVDGKVEVVEKPVAVKPGESIDVGVDGTPSIGTGDDTTEGNLTVNFSGAPAGTIVTVTLDGAKATQVKSGEKVTAVTGKDLTLNITVPRGYKANVTGADKATAKDADGKDQYTISAISDKAAVVNITFTERKVYTLTLSGEKLVYEASASQAGRATPSNDGEIYGLTAQGENDKGILFPATVPSGLTPDKTGKYVRTFQVYEGEFVEVTAKAGAITADSVKIIDGVAVNMKQAAGSSARATATAPSMLTFTMPGKNFSLYMDEADKLSANAQTDPVDGNMVAVYVDEALTVTANKDIEVVNGVSYAAVGTELTISGSKWASFSDENAISVAATAIKKDGEKYTVVGTETAYIKPVVAMTIGNTTDVKVYDKATNGAAITSGGVVKGSTVYVNLLNGTGLMAWAVESNKTADDAPVVGDTTLTKPATGRIAYTLNEDVVLNAGVLVNLGTGVKAYAESGTAKTEIKDGQYVKYNTSVSAETTGTVSEGSAVVGLKGSEAFAANAYTTAPATKALTLTVAPKVTFNYIARANYGTESAQTVVMFEDGAATNQYFFVKPGTWIKASNDSLALPVVTGDDSVEAIEVTGENGTVKFQVGTKSLTVSNSEEEDAALVIGDSCFIYDKASWIEAYNAGVRGITKWDAENKKFKEYDSAEAGWTDLDAHGKATFPWLLVKVENPTEAAVTFTTTVKIDGVEVQDQKSAQRTVTPTNWSMGEGSTGGWIHWELNRNSDKNVHSLDTSETGYVGTYTLDLTVGGKTLANKVIGTFTQDMKDEMCGISVPTTAEFASLLNAPTSGNTAGAEEEAATPTEGENGGSTEGGNASTGGDGESETPVVKPEPLTQDGQSWAFKNGTLTIYKAFDLTKDSAEGGAKDLQFYGLKMKGNEGESGSAWFVDNVPSGKTYDHAIVMKFTNPLGASKTNVKFEASVPTGGVVDTTDENGVTYYILAVNENSKSFKVYWSAANNNSEYQQPLEVKIDWQAN